MEHYYSKKPSSEYSEKIINKEFQNIQFRFYTSPGVFSKNNVDFGTVQLINSILKDMPGEEKRVLDIGCGYGPIGIVISAFFPLLNMDMTDINERAVELSKKNAEFNKIKNTTIFLSDEFGNIEEKYDVIITNPPIRAGKKTIYSIFKGAHGHLLKNGRFYCVIQKKQGAESVQKKLIELFGNCEIIGHKSGYRVLCSKLRTPTVVI